MVSVTHDFITLDSCEDPSTWSKSADASTPTVNNTEYWEGSGSLDIGKSGTSESSFYYEKDFSSPLDLQGSTGKSIYLQLFVASTDTLNKLTNVAIYIEDSNGNWARWYVKNGIKYGYGLVTKPLRVGWNVLRLPLRNSYGYLLPLPDEVSSSYPDASQISKYRIEFYVSDASVTIASGELKIDYLRYGSYAKYGGGTSASPLTTDDVVNDDVKEYIGFGHKIDYKTVEFYLPVTFTDELDLEDITVIVISNGHDNNITDDNSTGKIFRSLFYLYGGLSWYYSQTFALRGNALLDTVTVSVSAETSRIGLYVYTPINNLKFGNLNPGRIDLYANNVSGIDASGTGYSSSRVGFGVSNGNYYNVYLANISIWTTYFNRTVNIYNGRIVGDVTISTSGYNGNTFNFYDIDGFVDVENSDSNNYTKYYYSIKAQMVDETGTPIDNATVELYDDTNTLIGSTTTDSNGWMVDKIYFLRREYGKDSSGNVIDNWHKVKVVVTKNGRTYYSGWLEINARFEGTIIVYNAYSVGAWVEKTPIQLNEPIYLYVKVLDWSGKPITGLSVTGVVTKPSGATDSITFNDEGNGIYDYYFTDTDEVGRYNTEITVNIGGNNVLVELNFDVGVIEQKIDNLSNQLKKHDAKLDAYKWMG